MALSASVQAVGLRRCCTWAHPWRRPLPSGAVASSLHVCCMWLFSSPCPWTKDSRVVVVGSLPHGWSRGAPLGRQCSFPGRSCRHVRGREVNQMSTQERARAGTPLRSIQQSSLFLRSLPLSAYGWEGWEASPHSQAAPLKSRWEDLPEDNRG